MTSNDNRNSKGYDSRNPMGFFQRKEPTETRPVRDWDGREEAEAKKAAAWKAIEPLPIGPERAAAVDHWMNVNREGHRRENIARERERQLSGERGRSRDRLRRR